jgi:hypothetical protein
MRQPHQPSLPNTTLQICIAPKTEPLVVVYAYSLMSLVASALRMELDVSMYLESVITHRLRGTAKLEELLPDRWRANHPEAVREYREQERRDKADVASVQAAKRRSRGELRKKK